MSAVRFTVDGPPQGKARPRVTRTGHAYTPAKTRNYEATVRLAAQQAMEGLVPLDGPLSVLVRAAFPVPASWSKGKQARARANGISPTVKPDADNIAKTLDALNGIVFVDDKQVVRLVVEKVYGDKPGVSFLVEQVTNTEAA